MSEQELEKIQGDSSENLYEEGSYGVFRTPASKRDDKEFILGVYKIVGGLKGWDRNGLFSISSNVNMRGHGIKPVKATFEQAKGSCSSSNRKQTCGTPPKAF